MGASGLDTGLASQYPRYSGYTNVSQPMFNAIGAQSGRVGAGGPVPIAPPSVNPNPFSYGFNNAAPLTESYFSPGFQRPPLTFQPAFPGGGASANGAGAAFAPAAASSPAPIPVDYTSGSPYMLQQQQLFNDDEGE